ncbi:EthD domain-containing protein [Woodsholea maritima]|uniref:EthD domain-containing protein n=1 Tax=Woodsholea maritima TaxID=240237 RepID=UPI00036EBC2A|nr:EthD domain-containing protein [Woodsholea maritima]
MVKLTHQVKLAYFVRRRPDLTPDEFRQRWRETHSGLVETLCKTLNARRYVASFPLNTNHSVCLKDSRGLYGNCIDAFLEIWWDDIETYDRSFGSAQGLEALEKIIDAERRFIDFSKSSASLTHEEVLFDIDENIRCC